MKNTLLSAFLVAAALGSANAQISLTSSSHQFAPGDSYFVESYDTVLVVPRNTGANQTWDFSDCLSATPAASLTYSFVDASTVSGWKPAGANLAQTADGSTYSFYSTGTSSMDYIGLRTSDINFDFSSAPVTYRAWSVDYSDWNESFEYGTFSSTNPNLPPSGQLAGRVDYGVTGYGTLSAPDGTQYDNVLQIIDSTTFGLSWVESGYTVSYSWFTKSYKYYVAEEKYPVLQFDAQNSTSMIFDASFNLVAYDSQDTYQVLYNEVVSTADVAAANLDKVMIYPNPADDQLFVVGSDLMVSVHALDGKLIMEQEVNGMATLDINSLESGVYVLNLTDDAGNQRTERLVKK